MTRDAQRYIDAANGLQVADRDTLLSWIAAYTRERQAYLPRQRFLSCFVSYSHKDEEFVKRLVARLRVASVRVWFAPEDLAGGKKLYEEISSAIDRFDRLLVVLSQNSMQSEWVKTEIRNARKREVKNGGRVLFPIALVSYRAIQNWELFDADLGHDLARELREYYIPDFSNWRIPATFEEQFAKVIAGLNTA